MYFLEKIWKSLHSLKPHPSPCLFRHNCQQCISGRLCTFFRFFFPVWMYVALKACLICRGAFLSWQSSGVHLCNNSVTTFPAVPVRFLLVFIKSGFTSKAGLTTVSCSTILRFKLLPCPWRVEILYIWPCIHGFPTWVFLVGGLEARLHNSVSLAAPAWNTVWQTIFQPHWEQSGDSSLPREFIVPKIIPHTWHVPWKDSVF